MPSKRLPDWASLELSPSVDDGEFRLPLVLSQGSPFFHSRCEGEQGIALESLQGLRFLPPLEVRPSSVAPDPAVLVTIEMCNALNRWAYAPSRHLSGSDLTGALLASAQLLPFHSNKDKGLLGEG